MLRALLMILAVTLAAPAFAKDPHSFANTEAFRTEHLKLELSVDFNRKQLSGVAELLLARPVLADELSLDTRALSIESVEAAPADLEAWLPKAYQLDAPDDILGSRLRIRMAPNERRVRIRYRTSPDASGLQWLAPEQTAGKQQPFLFSQSQAIHARSWVPLQDTPGVRFTFEARIHTPANLLAVMGAVNEPDAVLDGDYRFAMRERIPSYLMALAVGDLRFAATGPRSGIYAEPSVLQAAAAEFADTESMIAKAEAQFGPYRWGRFDLLVLPPSFPFGGMENPRLTFASPTVIAGDKSLVALVAHELAHSWSGNLVTNATWRDFWLNESTTSYLTNRIMEAVYGEERGDMERVLEAEELLREFDALPEHQKIMAPVKASDDPEDYASIVAYNRGSLLLYTLERLYGRERFDAFLTRWFNEHAFSSRTTEEFTAFAHANLLQGDQPPRFTDEQLQAWLTTAPLSKDAILPSSSAFTTLARQRDAWLAGKLPTAQLPLKDWNTLHWAYFLDNMPLTVSLKQLAELDAAAQLTQSHNRFLLRSWLSLAVKRGYHAADAAVKEHLLAVGRTYLIRSVYEALAETPAGLKRARTIYAEARPLYHPITRAAVERVLK